MFYPKKNYKIEGNELVTFQEEYANIYTPKSFVNINGNRVSIDFLKQELVSFCLTDNKITFLFKSQSPFSDADTFSVKDGMKSTILTFKDNKEALKTFTYLDGI